MEPALTINGLRSLHRRLNGYVALNREVPFILNITVLK